MAEYMVETKHRPEDCLRALDEIMDYDEELLDNFVWGCRSGEHTGWALVDAESESDVKDVLSPSLRDDAHIIEVGRFTPDQLKAEHEAAS